MSIWSALAKVGLGVAAPFTGGATLAAMPFVDPVSNIFTGESGGIPTGKGTPTGSTGSVWGDLAKLGIGAGGVLGASALGNLLGGGPQTTPLQNQVFQQQLEAGRLGMDTARQLLPQGQNLLTMGAQQMQSPMNYWSSILSGNRGLATSALAPEISRIGQGYQTAANTSAALMPRGGPSAAFNAELPFAQQRDVSSLLQSARPAAAGSLLGAAQNIGGLGSSLLGSGISAIYGATQAGRDIISQQQAAQEAAAKRGEKIGTGLFGLINQYGMPALDKIFKKTPGGGGTIGTGTLGTGTDVGPGY